MLYTFGYRMRLELGTGDHQEILPLVSYDVAHIIAY